MTGDLHEQIIAALEAGAEVSFRKLDQWNDLIAVIVKTEKGGQRQKIESSMSIRGVRLFNGDLMADEIRKSMEILK